MKIKVEREIDVDRLLINLDIKSQCKEPGIASYDVTVNKQILRDAHDVIVELMNQKMGFTVNKDCLCYGRIN